MQEQFYHLSPLLIHDNEEDESIQVWLHVHFRNLEAAKAEKTVGDATATAEVASPSAAALETALVANLFLEFKEE